MIDRKVNSALMQTIVCALKRAFLNIGFLYPSGHKFQNALNGTGNKSIKTACEKMGEACIFGDLSLFIKGVFKKQRPFRRCGGGISFRMSAL